RDRSSRRPRRARVEIFEGLRRLGAEVARAAGEFAVKRHAELAGQIDRARGPARLHHMSIAAGCGHGRRIEKFVGGHWSGPPGMRFFAPSIMQSSRDKRKRNSDDLSRMGCSVKRSGEEV